MLIATDGESALRLIEQITPDLVLMDAVMPGLNGFETCRRMKRNKMLGALPVIFMTGLTETENVLEGLAAGGVDYVTKPLVVDELLARIRVHLANARVAAGTRAALDATGRFLLATDRCRPAAVVHAQGAPTARRAVPARERPQRQPAGRHDGPAHAVAFRGRQRRVCWSTSTAARWRSPC